MFRKKFSCARTKCEAIITNMLAPEIVKKLNRDLLIAKFVIVSVDCSNKGSLKLYSILVRYFLPLKGVHVKLLEVHSVPEETAEMLFDKMWLTIQKFQING